LRALVARLEPGVLNGHDAGALVEAFAEAERLGAAGRALAARRVEETNQWRLEGHRSAASWVAAKTGSSVGSAAGAIETAKRLDELPATREAFVAGRLSEAQAREVVSAAAARPSSESKLLAFAEREPLRALKDECRRVVAAAATDEVEWQERIRRRRYLQSWCDEEGAVCLRARYAPDDGAKLLALVEARQNVVFREARKAGRREPYAAYAADALLELVTGTAGPTKATLNLRVDHAAMVRGHTEGAEVCEIAGVGPVPVATARALAEDAYLKVIVTDGADVRAVAHQSRYIPAKLRTAIEARDPVCCVPGCEVSRFLEIDHIEPRLAGGLTTFENLARLCSFHHALKTVFGWRLGGRPGAWTWSEPERTERAPPALN